MCYTLYSVLTILTSLFAGLFLDRLVLVNPPGHALLVRVLQPEVVRLQDVEMSKNMGEELVAQTGSLKHEICQRGACRLVS